MLLEEKAAEEMTEEVVPTSEEIIEKVVLEYVPAEEEQIQTAPELDLEEETKEVLEELSVIESLQEVLDDSEAIELPDIVVIQNSDLDAESEPVSEPEKGEVTRTESEEQSSTELTEVIPSETVIVEQPGIILIREFETEEQAEPESEPEMEEDDLVEPELQPDTKIQEENSSSDETLDTKVTEVTDVVQESEPDGKFILESAEVVIPEPEIKKEEQTTAEEEREAQSESALEAVSEVPGEPKPVTEIHNAIPEEQETKKEPLVHKVTYFRPLNELEGKKDDSSVNELKYDMEEEEEESESRNPLNSFQIGSAVAKLFKGKDKNTFNRKKKKKRFH
jgi:hypothetical protein